LVFSTPSAPYYPNGGYPIEAINPALVGELVESWLHLPGRDVECLAAARALLRLLGEVVS
jgi:hypothetical protein